MATFSRIWYCSVFAASAVLVAAGAALAYPSDVAAPSASAGRTAQGDIVLASNTPTRPPTTRTVAAKAWEEKTRNAISRLTSSLNDLSGAVESKDFTAMQEACGRISQAGHDIGAALPAPKAALTDRLQAAVGDFTVAGSKCNTLVPGASNEVVQGVLADVKSGMGHLHDASLAMADASP